MAAVMEFKATEIAGTGRARVSALDTLHSDGDVVRPGSLRNKHATVSPRDHATFVGIEPPVGFAKLYEEDGYLWAEITFHDGDACEFARATKGWSVGYVVDESHKPTGEELAAFGPKLKRVITAWRIIEVTPVSKGRVPASPDTGSEEVCCGGTCTVGGKSCCGQCAQREAVIRELGRFELTRSKLVLREAGNALQAAESDYVALEEHELKAYQVAGDVRAAAEEAVELAAEILGGDPPRIRWYHTDAIPEVKAYGVHYAGEPEIWLAALDDAGAVYDTAAHEAFHALSAKGSDEAAARSFGAAMGILRGVTLHVGSRKRYEGELVRIHDYSNQKVRCGALPDGALVVEGGALYRRADEAPGGWVKVAALDAA